MLLRRHFLLAAAAAPIAAPARAASLPRVAMTTAFGTLMITLRSDRAPLSANDFLHYVDTRAYDDGRFFRVVRPGNDHGHPPINVVQGGVRPDVVPLKPVAHENTQMTGLRHIDGAISLTRDAPGTGSGSEFFISVGDLPGLDFGGKRNPDGQGFAVFGHVDSGMDGVRKIWQLAADGHADDTYTQGQILTQPVKILSARRVM